MTHLRTALTRALDHDVLNTAKAAAYSGMLTFFPAALVFTTLLASVQEGSTVIGVIRGTFDQILPPASLSLLENSLNDHQFRSTQLLLSATSLTIYAGMGVMLSLMEGFRRAYELPRASWGFWQRRIRSLLLVPIALLPLCLASLMLVFGRQIEVWMIANADHELRYVVIVFWRMVRWSVAVITSVSVLSALYHFGTPRKEHWGWVLPGAFASTAIWFPATLAFGWYVTRTAEYSRYYGSFAAGIATLVWLYLTSFSCIIGAELNGVLFHGREVRRAAAAENPAPTEKPALTSL